MTSPLPAPGAPLPHYVSSAAFDPQSIEAMTDDQSRIFLASQWRLMWWKFKRHRLALYSGIFLAVLYSSILISEFLAPYNLHTRNMDFIYAPPARLHLFHEGTFIGPFVYGRDSSLDMTTLKRVYTDNRGQVQPVRFFCRGDSYRFWGIWDGDRHLICPAENGDLFVLGTDRLGRDLLSRIIYGARVSLTIGLLGVAVSFVLGIVIGGIAGFHGGVLDLAIQRVIEVLQSLPSIPLWLSLAAIMPASWSPIAIYLSITIILGLLDWTGLARAVRSKLLSLREEEYVLAAQLVGAKNSRIIVRHLIPGFISYLIASATLAIPGMILGETALSFLGLGLRQPITSWGILLTEAKNISVVALYPWLLFSMVPVILVVLTFNFFGDGLRDAADPYR